MQRRQPPNSDREGADSPEHDPSLSPPRVSLTTTAKTPRGSAPSPSSRADTSRPILRGGEDIAPFWDADHLWTFLPNFATLRTAPTATA